MTTAVASVAALGGVSAYVVLASARAEIVLLALGASATALLGLGLAARWSPLVATALVVAGGTYAASLVLADGAVDSRAPLVAASLLLAAELAYWSLGRSVGRAPARVAARIAATLLAAAAVCLPLGVLILAASGAAFGRGLALEAAGLLAAAAALAVVARLSRETHAAHERR